jgi:hypothetical protein
MSLVYGAADGMPRYLGQIGSGGGEPGYRGVRLSVAEALRSRFPLRNEPGAQPRTTPVAEALRSRFPGSALAETGRPTLPRRIRNMSVSARPAEPSANPELLLRILDGLQRL